MATATYTRRTPEQGVLYEAFVREWPIIRALSRVLALPRVLAFPRVRVSPSGME
jgi:hypothetical protein